jgi:sialic acid synthase SpsE
MARIIAELGSCHMGRLDRIYEAIDICRDLDLELKLQLFPDAAPYVPTNIYLAPALFTAALSYANKRGVTLSASCFDDASFYYLAMSGVRWIKFAFSKKEQAHWIKQAIDSQKEAIVSCDVMTERLVPAGATKLYCIPEYPVRYEVNFDELFPRFAGFSDHTLGLRQTQKALAAGAKIIEKHVRLSYGDETCPDAQFAVNIHDLGKLTGR